MSTIEINPSHNAVWVSSILYVHIEVSHLDRFNIEVFDCYIIHIRSVEVAFSSVGSLHVHRFYDLGFALF